MSEQSVYQAADERAVRVDLSAHGHLIASDRDRIDLLHRLSTNNLAQLEAGQFMPTIFTNANARIIDLVTVFHRGETTVIVTGEGRGALMANWLRRNIFFNDKFQLTEAGDSWGHLGVFGPQAGTVLDGLWPGSADLPDGHFLDADGLLLSRVNAVGGEGYWLLGETAAIQAAQDKLAGADVPQAGRDVYEVLRIETGVPAAGHELTDDYIPLELGLWRAISFNKGCYTGQEIIARMESRGQLAKQLFRVRLSGPVPAGTDLLDDDGRTAGTLTSSAQRPGQAEAVGLAVLRRKSAEPGMTLRAQLPDDPSVTVQVEALAGHYEPVY